MVVGFGSRMDWRMDGKYKVVAFFQLGDFQISRLVDF